MWFQYLFFGFLIFSPHSRAEQFEQEVSAVRPLNMDYTFFEKKILEESKDQKMLLVTSLATARTYSPSKLESLRIVTWKSLKDMQQRFEQIRDERLIKVSQDGPLRRISWLYPRDGSFARASMFNRFAFGLYIPVPQKVFAFGNLLVRTKNAPRGVVGWWYHVAPIVEVNKVKYVLDPAIEPQRPLTLDEWLGRMGKPEKIKVAICHSGSYSPRDNCEKDTDGLELRAGKTQKHYLILEEKELKRLGRNTKSELGDFPPWK
jgi:hypothetical protein